MAEYESAEPEAVAVAEVKVVEADLDDFADVVQEKFEEAVLLYPTGMRNESIMIN